MSEQQENNNRSGYGFAIILFVVGIIALIGAIIIGRRSASSNLLFCEVIGLICLAGLLIISIRAQRRTIRQRQQKRSNPYAGVDKHEIDKILDLINEREQKRKMREAFAAGEDAARSEAENEPEEDTNKDENELRFLVIDDEAEERKNKEKETDKAGDNTDNKESSAENAKKEERKEDSAKDDNPGGKSRKDGESMSYDDYDRPRRRERDPYYDERSRQRAPRDERGRERGGQYPPRGGYYDDYDRQRRRERDPYYDDYYDERSRQRAPRDERGRERDPYARERYYGEYEEQPARRRPAPPYDDRRPRRRRPDDYPDSRQPRYDEDERRRPTGPVAPGEELKEEIEGGAAAAAPAAEKREYDENYVPVALPDDDYDFETASRAHSGRAGIGSLSRPEPPKADPRRDDGRYDDRYSVDDSVPVALPDDDYYASRYQDEPQRRNSQYAPKEQDKYVPDYEEESAVISLPRDDEYDEYVEKKEEEKRAAEAEREKEKRRAERRENGKIALTIVKIRRKKIHRKSRRYKSFRASVNHLGDYLNSFSARYGKR